MSQPLLQAIPSPHWGVWSIASVNLEGAHAGLGFDSGKTQAIFDLFPFFECDPLGCSLENRKDLYR